MSLYKLTVSFSICLLLVLILYPALEIHLFYRLFKILSQCRQQSHDCCKNGKALQAALVLTPSWDTLLFHDKGI